MPRPSSSKSRARAGVSSEQYKRLVASYRVRPGEHTHAAGLAGCSPNTAKKAWERGLLAPPEAKVPIREQLAAERQRLPPTPAGEPGKPTDGSGDPGQPAPARAPLGPTETADKVALAQYDDILLSDQARGSCVLLNQMVVRIAPTLLKVGDRAGAALDELLKKARDKDPEKEAKRCLGLVKLGAQIGRTVSLITKSQNEADRALWEALRVPFAVQPLPEAPGGGPGGDGDGLSDEELLADLEEAEANRAATLARIRRRRELAEAAERGEAPPPEPVEKGEPKPGAPPPVRLGGTQPDTASPPPPASPAPPAVESVAPAATALDQTRAALLAELGADLATQLEVLAREHGVTVDAVVQGVLGRTSGPGVDGDAIMAAVTSLDDATIEAVIGLGARWPVAGP